MKTSSAFVFFFIQLFVGGAEMIFKRQTAGQTLSLSCNLQQDHGSPSDLHLYHRDTQSQTTVLSMVRDGGVVRVDPDRRARTRLHGGLTSEKVNVSISPLEPSDTGLYVLELSYRVENGSDRVVPCASKTFLLVEGSGSLCSLRYPPLLLTIFSAAGLLLLVLVWLAADKCLQMKAKQHHKTLPHAPIYEEMSWRQQRSESPQNNSEAPSHLQEVHFPVYANPHRQPQDNYYACPRQLALRA